jgi:predicted lysophospholipase L1 biosynthesis ABC-type transport system permease subunit
MEYTSTEHRTIVGVIEDVITTDRRDPQPTVYLPLGQVSYVFGELTLAARIDPRNFDVAAYHSRLDRLMPDFPVHEVRTIDSLRHDSLARYRILSLSAMSLAAIAMLVATMGIIGQLRLQFAREMKAIAIRSALGASTRRLVAESLRPILLLVLLGIGIGAFAIVLSTRFLVFDGWFEFIGTQSAIMAGVIGVIVSAALGSLEPLRALSNVALMDRLTSL